MTELVIVSGKGGTGKTSLVGALAAMSKDKVLVDCDVDAADLHLILSSNKQRISEFTGGKQADIDDKRCTCCGICFDSCRFDAIEREPYQNNEGGERFRVNRFTCDGCGVCVRQCPENAIDFNDVISGAWYLSDTPYGPLVHARLGYAQANSGKLISLLRQRARMLAEQKELDLIIIDGPPGIGCPVISSVTGAGYILIVTEPSMSAIHDMERLLKLVKHFGIPAGICINKSDINLELTTEIENTAKKNKIKILGRIPFDPAVTEAQLAGTTIVEHHSNGAPEEIMILWSNLAKELSNAVKISADNRSL